MIKLGLVTKLKIPSTINSQMNGNTKAEFFYSFRYGSSSIPSNIRSNILFYEFPDDF